MLATITFAGETIATDDNILLVASKSQPGVWYQQNGSTCSCPSFRYRSNCRHIVATAALVESVLAGQPTEQERQAERQRAIAAFNQEAWG
jgi:hypothetical protein